MGISVNKTYIDRWINEQKRREEEGERERSVHERWGLKWVTEKQVHRWIENSKNG